MAAEPTTPQFRAPDGSVDFTVKRIDKNSNNAHHNADISINILNVSYALSLAELKQLYPVNDRVVAAECWDIFSYMDDFKYLSATKTIQPANDRCSTLICAFLMASTDIEMRSKILNGMYPYCEGIRKMDNLILQLAALQK